MMITSPRSKGSPLLGDPNVQFKLGMGLIGLSCMALIFFPSSDLPIADSGALSLLEAQATTTIDISPPKQQQPQQAQIISPTGIQQHRQLQVDTEDIPEMDFSKWEHLPVYPQSHTRQHARQHNCPAGDDLLKYIKNRIKRQQKGNEVLPWPWTTLGDRWGLYVWAKRMGIPIPEIYDCGTDGNIGELKEDRPMAIKVNKVHSNRGVYLFLDGFGGQEHLTGKNMTQQQVASEFQKHNVEEYHLEEILADPNTGIPHDYKFYSANGEISHVFMALNRGSPNKCAAYVDEHFHRVDDNGCFTNKQQNIVAHNKTGKAQCATPERGNPNKLKTYPRCADFAPPPEWPQMVAMAKKISKLIGIFVRVDLFVNNGKIYLGETTFCPSAGSLHCVSKRNPTTGCLDACAPGRIWKRQNQLHGNVDGGPLHEEPDFIKGWDDMPPEERCQRVKEVNQWYSSSSQH